MYIKKFTKSNAKFELNFEGFNSDITEPYYWHVNFPLVAKAYKTFKLEDNHYFSSSSKFGQEFRAGKGNSIRVFQENFNQLIALLKQHLLPSLEEVKLAEMYKKWFDEVEVSYNKLQEVKDEKDKKRYKAKLDEAIVTLKNKWVSEVDQGRLYQLSKRGDEQGLDFALLDTLFFGTTIPDPLKVDTLTEQLDNLVTPIETTETTKRVLKDFLYRFHMWLPTALKQTKSTFKIRLNTLKQFYSQFQLQIRLLKPVLKEIKAKQESLGTQNFYEGMDDLDPLFTNLNDASYSHTKLMLIKKFKNNIKDLDFTKDGYKISGKEIIDGPAKGKNGYIVGSDKDGGNYFFRELNSDNTLKEEIKISKSDLNKYPVIFLDFSQKRYSKIVNTPQGQAMMPYNMNNILYEGFALDLYECASYVKKLKKDELELIETFVSEVSIIKDELLNYVDNVDMTPDEEKFRVVREEKKEDKSSKDDSGKKEDNFLILPFKGVYELFLKPIVDVKDLGDKITDKVKKDKKKPGKAQDIEVIQVDAIENTWKLYTVFKKTHGFVQY